MWLYRLRLKQTINTKPDNFYPSQETTGNSQFSRPLLLQSVNDGAGFRRQVSSFRAACP